MALNFTISYTFSPSTTISSSQVNTNTSDVANVFIGLEAETKTLAKLKVDIDPTLALEVATKQYVDHYSTWRRPVLQFTSVTTVTVESGLDGTSGDVTILFPDGTVRTDATASHTVFDITRNCSLSGTALSGLRATLSEGANTWYSLYAVKVTDSATTWVTVGDTRENTQGNYAALNTAFGTNGWVYLGKIRNGDNSGATSDILNFSHTGNLTQFTNLCTGQFSDHPGIRFAATSGATSLTYSATRGTGTTDIPTSANNCVYYVACASGSGNTSIRNAGQTKQLTYITGTNNFANRFTYAVDDGINIINSSSVKMDIALVGFWDGTLGVGSHPLL